MPALSQFPQFGQSWRPRKKTNAWPWMAQGTPGGGGATNALSGLMGNVFGGDGGGGGYSPSGMQSAPGGYQLPQMPAKPWSGLGTTSITPAKPFGPGGGANNALSGLMGNFFGGTSSEDEGDTGVNPIFPDRELYDGGGNAPIPDMTTLPGGTKTGGWDFWSSIRDLMGDNVTDEQFNALQSNFGARKNWRIPKNAQDMLETAQLMKLLGMEDEAAQLAVQALNLGYRQPRWDLNTMFGPLFRQWGLQYGNAAR